MSGYAQPPTNRAGQVELKKLSLCTVYIFQPFIPSLMSGLRDSYRSSIQLTPRSILSTTLLSLHPDSLYDKLFLVSIQTLLRGQLPLPAFPASMCLRIRDLTSLGQTPNNDLPIVPNAGPIKGKHDAIRPRCSSNEASSAIR